MKYLVVLIYTLTEGMQNTLMEIIAGNFVRPTIAGIVVAYNGDDNTVKFGGKYNAEGCGACFTGPDKCAIACVPNSSGQAGQAGQNFCILAQVGKTRLVIGSTERIKGFPLSNFTIKAVYVTDLFLIVAVLTGGSCDKCAVLNAYKIHLKDFVPIYEDGEKFYKTEQLICNDVVTLDISVLICDLGYITCFSRTGRCCECIAAHKDTDDHELDHNTSIVSTYGDLVAICHDTLVGAYVMRNDKVLCYFSESTKLHITYGGVIYCLNSRVLAVYILVNDVAHLACCVDGCIDIQKRGQYIHLIFDDQSSKSYAQDVINQRLLIDSAAYAVYKRETKEKSSSDSDSAIVA